MQRFTLLFLLLASASLIACPSGRRGGGGGGGDDDDSAADDDDATSGDDDDGVTATHGGDTTGTFGDGLATCQGSVEIAVDFEDISSGSFDCSAPDYGECSGTWSGGYVGGESQPAESSFECVGADSGGSVAGDMWLWSGDGSVSGSISMKGGPFGYVSIGFSASPLN